MDPTLWFTFALTYLALCLLPGPSVAVVLSQTLSGGRRAAAFCILGDMAASLVLIAVSFFGISAVLGISAELFVIVKWAGVAYMAMLGLLMIRDAHAIQDALPVPRPAPARSLRAGFLTGILNPKGTAFYVAFLAQFVDPARDALPQFLVIVATVWMVIAAVLATYPAAAATARHLLTGARARRRMGYLGGSFLLGGSAVLATQRSA
ncbi:MAG: LysE family translocator [Pseudomonadota bacterium]